MNRTQKAESVASLHEAFKGHELVVVSHYSGLTVAQMSKLRRAMLGAGAHVRVAKNRLARIALKGTSFESMDGLLKGPTAIAFSVDPVAAAKVAVDFAKDNEKFKIIGGSMSGVNIDAKAVEALAKLPSLNELRSSLLRMIVTPATRIATITAAPATQLARVLAAHAEKEQ